MEIISKFNEVLIMKVWRVLSDNNTRGVYGVGDRVFDIFTDFVGEPMNITDVIKLAIEEKGKFYDLPYMGGGSLVFSEKSFEVLGKMIAEEVQFIDAEIVQDKCKLTLINVFNVMDAIDYDRSIPERRLSGRVKGFKKLNFKLEAINSRNLFKTPESGIRIYATDNFRDAVLASKLGGLEFVEVWDSERNDEMEIEDQRRYEVYLEEIEKNKGIEYNWEEAVELINRGKVVISGPWKMKVDENEVIQIARLSMDCNYNWINSNIIPPILLGLKWHVKE